MKVLVLGAGVIGAATAWSLLQAGHEVVLMDAESGPARATSFANAGEISPGYSAPWASPGVRRKALSWLFSKHPPLIIQPSLDPDLLRWLFAMSDNCTSARYEENKSRMVRIAEYSRDCLIALRGEIGIEYEGRAQGTLQVFHTQKQLDDIGKDVEVLSAGGVPFEVLDRRGCIAVEPGLALARDRIIGGLRLPNDETGDCFKFTNALVGIAKARGLSVQYDTRVNSFLVDADRIVAVETDRGRFTADRYIVALGTGSASALRPIGLRLPIYPVKGYSITANIVNADSAPVSTVVDESYKVAMTRLGDRIRVGGMAELAGYDRCLPARRRATLVHVLENLFPGAGDTSSASYWTGLRPMTPDGTPIIGPTKYPNLFMNTGHGTLGWTMACGSGQIIADMISGTEPAIETADLSIARYARH